MRISVVVPTYRRPELLERCLRALVNQSLSAWEYEIIVADDAASDDTRQQVRFAASGGRPGATLHYIEVEGKGHGPSVARNMGWRAAQAPVVGFTDDDTIPAADWLEQAAKLFDDRRVDAAWGRISVPLSGLPTDYERDAAGLESAGFVSANCFVRRAVLEQLGGFDEAFGAAWREDSDLYFRLLDARHWVEYVPEAVVVHPVRRAAWGVSVRQQQKATYDALLYKKHPKHYDDFVRPGRPWSYYPIVAALAGMVIGAVTGNPNVTMVCAAVWLALTLNFTLRRLRGTSRTLSHRAEMVITSALVPPVSVFWRVQGAVRHRVLFW
ncbi:MAG: glycosyl transferase family 2 [Gemmatimonadetes bacterium]|nr:glycosyl transferase family 2 [Gemmatimonadota bacterium]